MRKDELLYLHQLLATVRRDLERRGELADVQFDSYDALSVTPLAAHVSKGEHEEAVRHLATTLAAAVDRQEAASRKPQPASS